MVLYISRFIDSRNSCGWQGVCYLLVNVTLELTTKLEGHIHNLLFFIKTYFNFILKYFIEIRILTRFKLLPNLLFLFQHIIMTSFNAKSFSEFRVDFIVNFEIV